MPTCDNCGEFVSHTFARLAEIEGEIPGCPECAENRAEILGARR